MGLSYIWDYEIDEAQFQALLDRKQRIGRLDSDWAAIRLLEYAPYEDIMQRLGFERLLEGWPKWRAHIRWIDAPDPDTYIQQLNTLGKSLIIPN